MSWNEKNNEDWLNHNDSNDLWSPKPNNPYPRTQQPGSVNPPGIAVIIIIATALLLTVLGLLIVIMML